MSLSQTGARTVNPRTVAAWVPEKIWRELEEADALLDEAGRGAYAEAGHQVEAASVLLEQRAERKGTRLNQAVRRLFSYELMMAHALNEGWEPVPGEPPGTMRQRKAGPLPLAERRRLAAELGVPPGLIKDGQAD